MAKVMHNIRQIAVVSLLMMVIGCAATFSNHGYAPTDAQLEDILVGVDNRSSVEETVGRPSNTGVLREGGWFYVSSQVRHYAYKRDEVIDRQLVAIRFDKRGTVTNVERFALEDGRVIALNRRVTNTGIKGVSFIRQMLGNIGQFSLEDAL
ncbi:MAG: outer membrane protein assembly factor BamE (lipoprotein component of BamABCDE complex) [Paracoccaceae bacterium]|jgi:outer membrane protein assembly factor BamE (lipoprotein component of BamABCDE complex)